MRFLIHTSRVLYPADTGGKIRSSKLFERLSKAHDVTMVCYRRPDEPEENLRAMRSCCSRLETVPWHEAERNSLRFYGDLARNLISPHPFAVQKYFDRRMADRLGELVRSEPYDVFLCDSVVPSRNVLPHKFRPLIVFEHNVESVIPRRQYEHEKNPLAKSYFYLQWLKFSMYYRLVAARHFDHFIMVSENDCQTIRELHGISHASAIPTGVDVDYFRSEHPEDEEHGIVFTGSMDWLPNIDGLQFFIEQVLPLIRRELPVKLWIVGRSPPSKVVAWGRSDSSIVVTGRVDDVRPYIDRAKLYIVPLRIGGGTRIKIFEAMAMGKAVVSTRVGAEGLPVTHEENIVLADEPAELARRAVELLRDDERRRALGDRARQLVTTHYTWDVAARRFAEICDEVVARFGRRPRTEATSQ